MENYVDKLAPGISVEFTGVFRQLRLDCSPVDEGRSSQLHWGWAWACLW